MSVTSDAGRSGFGRKGALDPLRFVPADARAAAAEGATGPLAVASAFSVEIADALRQLQVGLDALLAIGERGDFQALDVECLLKLAGEFEAHRACSVLFDNRVIEAAREDPSFTVITGEKRVARGLARALRIGVGEANARERRAQQLLPRDGFSQGELPPKLPRLADAIRDGEVTVGQVDEIGAAMRRIDSNTDVDASLREQAEETLVSYVGALPPADLRSVGEKLDEVLLPDGRSPDSKVTDARRGLRVGRQRYDGTYAISGYLNPAVKAQLDAVLSPLSAPRGSSDGMRDDRTADQRRHDALGDVLRRVLDFNGVPASGGTPATVHITVDMDAILAALGVTGEQAETRGECAPDDAGRWGVDGARRRAGGRYVGRVAGGDRITLEDLTRLAGEALLVPVWASNTRGVVAYGRERRIATRNQTNALIARDGGCSYPGCDAPPDWTQRHHVTEWWRGGRTDLDNLTLVCGHHHREFETNGWAVRMIRGLPWWIPPPWVDPEQKPIINARIRIPSMEDIAESARVVRAASAELADPDDDGDGLDPPEELIGLLAEHVADPLRRDHFHRELADLLDSYSASRELGSNVQGAGAGAGSAA
ncbi:HNH endonuclease signature motif containing protein [Cumulibacter soli]|uniref:HNH endonuclease signature motif containing protein n=1 Tax=Cumulibacter soli TaxID=2546344 RepID=UPI0014196C5E|nr:HNH endonuclease signature motif containing protein [Cumulibacter soli]